MTSNSPNPTNPVFKAPDPDQLQSEQIRKETLDNLAKTQGGETNAIEVDQNSTNPDDAPTDSVDVIDNLDNLADRHPLNIDSPPG